MNNLVDLKPHEQRPFLNSHRLFKLVIKRMLDNIIELEHQQLKAEAQKIQERFLAEKEILKQQLAAANKAPQEIKVEKADSDSMGLPYYEEDSIEVITKDDLIKEVEHKTKSTRNHDEFLLEVINEPSPRGKSNSIVSPHSHERGTWIYDSK